MRNDGGPAFPEQVLMSADGELQCSAAYGFSPGMSLRDWFAGVALQGLLSDPTLENTVDDYAESAYSLADAMLRARGGQ